MFANVSFGNGDDYMTPESARANVEAKLHARRISSACRDGKAQANDKAVIWAMKQLLDVELDAGLVKRQYVQGRE